jgi:glycosidase
MPGDGAAGGNPWHERVGAHYLGIFSEGMPDLNFDNPDVRKEIVKVGQFWMGQGADGFRLDAAKHIYGDFASSANKPETVQKNTDWWKEFRRGLDAVRPGAYLVGEVWDGPSVIAPYLGSLNSAFNFDLSKKLLAVAGGERSQNLADWLSKVYALYGKSSDGRFTDAPFLTNHDQNRVMSELGGNVDHAKTAAALLLTMPGRPFVYYGEEIGMKGAKPDETIREPFVWNEDGKPGGAQTSWEPLKFNGDGRVSAEAELKDPGSLLQHYKKLIAWRNELPGLQSGAIGEFAGAPETVAAYVRGEGKDRVLVAVNLSGQPAAVPLTAADGQPAFAKLLHATSAAAKVRGGKLELPVYTAAILK